MSRWVSSRATWERGSGGGILGMARGDTRRGTAPGCSGWTGKRPEDNHAARSADTRGPVVRARPTATGCPWKRVRRVWPHASMRLGAVCEPETRPSLSASRLSATERVWASAQSRPTKAAQGCGGLRLHGCSPRVWDRGAKGQAAGVLRRHESEPVTRQTLRRR